MVTFRSLLLFATCAALALGAQAQAQWKWRDAQGRIQYSDRPPPIGTPEKDILSRPPGARSLELVVPGAKPQAASAPARAASAPPRTEKEAQERAAREAQERIKAQEQVNAPIRAANCKNARDQLALLEAGVRMSQTTEQGERVLMDPATREAEIKRARAVISTECK